MKKTIQACLLGLMASSAYAADYSIEVCLIPLSEIVAPQAKMFVGSLQHVFMRSQGEGQNFEPETPMGFMGDAAKIRTQNYATADCQTVYETNNANEHSTTWKRVKDLYNNAAQKYQYSIADKNCQAVTKEVMATMNFSFPAAFEQRLQQQAACSIQ